VEDGTGMRNAEEEHTGDERQRGKLSHVAGGQRARDALGKAEETGSSGDSQGKSTGGLQGSPT
jgi:hypothetical protein